MIFIKYIIQKNYDHEANEEALRRYNGLEKTLFHDLNRKYNVPKTNGANNNTNDNNKKNENTNGNNTTNNNNNIILMAMGT